MENSVEKERSSIEEDIKNAEHFIKSIKTDKEYKEENGWHGYYNKEIVELARILEHILSDYKRILKEANRYKNMYEAEFEIHLVRNEQLERKENAVTKCNELIIENARLKEENKRNKLLLDTNKNFMIDKETKNYKWNVIETQEVEEKIEEIKKEKLGYSEDEWYLENEIKGYAIDKLQELLESEGK